jgi:hypothetical protein
MPAFLANFFRRLSSPKRTLPTQTDPLFGPLVHFPMTKTWAGKIHFPPIDREIEILVDAGDHGPAESHREFYHALLSRWPEIQTAIGAILFPPMKKWAKKHDEANPWSYFDLRGIRLPSLATEPVEWAISYWCPANHHFFDIQMSAWRPESLDISRR